MSRRPARCTLADYLRAAKVAKAEGVAVDVLPDGTIRLTPIESLPPKPAPVAEKRRIVL